MELVLYHPQSSAEKKPLLPLSMLALGAVIEDQWDYQIVDGNLIDDVTSHLATLFNAASPRHILATTVMPGPQLNAATPVCRELKRRFPGLIVIDHRLDDGYVTPKESAGEDAVYVSRMRVDPTVDHGLVFWCVADNLRKGAALNAVQIAEALVENHLS